MRGCATPAHGISHLALPAAVLAIIVTAPLGAFLTDITYKRLLACTPVAPALADGAALPSPDCPVAEPCAEQTAETPEGGDGVN